MSEQAYSEKYRADLASTVRQAEIIFGIDASDLPSAPEVRDTLADDALGSDPEQEAQFRELMANVGPGRVEDRDAVSVGLPEGYFAVSEGGQPHKIEAQARLVLGADVRPGTVIFAATDQREITADAEKDSVRNTYGFEPSESATEYSEMARYIIGQYGKGQEPTDLGIGYSMDGELTESGEGQLKLVGETEDGIAIVLMRVDREYSDDGKYKTLQTEGLTKVVAQLAKLSGVERSAIATSSTYEPSRTAAAEDAVITYGTRTLDLLRGGNGSNPPQPKLGQLIGELSAVRDALERLS